MAKFVRSGIVKQAAKKIYWDMYKWLPIHFQCMMNQAVRFYMARRKINFEIHLVEHCNLNCSGCDNYSPIAQEQYVDVHNFQKELKQMYRIFGDGIGDVKLLGGEPLLHPEIKDLCMIAREALPAADIRIVSNGLLLPRMDRSFFDVCRDNDIKISLTRYPICFPYEEWIEKMAGMGVACSFFNSETIKTLCKKPLDLTGGQDRERMFGACMTADHCISLKDGRLYTCTTIPNVIHFNQEFGKDLKVTEEDFIDIFKVTDPKQIRRFLSHSVPFCRYCDIRGEKFNLPWRVSEKDINEWI